MRRKIHLAIGYQLIYQILYFYRKIFLHLGAHRVEGVFPIAGAMGISDSTDGIFLHQDIHFRCVAQLKPRPLQEQAQPQFQVVPSTYLRIPPPAARRNEVRTAYACVLSSPCTRWFSSSVGSVPSLQTRRRWRRPSS